VIKEPLKKTAKQKKMFELIENVKIKGTILKHFRGEKKIIYKMKSKKKTRRKRGHRQELTRVLIKTIGIK